MFARKDWHHWVAAALLVLHGVLAWTGRAFGINTGNDDAVYLLLARSIRDFGYSDTYLVGSPLHSQYPPGFPALLALVSLPFGERFDVLLGVIALCSVLALALVYDTVRRRSGAGVALTVLALCCLNPELIWYAGQLMSESAYLMFTTLAIWAVLREPAAPAAAPAASGASATPPSRNWWPVIAVFAAVGAALTRMIGVTMFGALIVLWLIERRYRRALLLAAPGILAVGGWLLWTIVAPDKIVGRSYIADAIFAANRQSFAEVLIGRVTTNTSGYLSNSLPSIIPQPTIAGTIMDNVVGILALLTLGAIGAAILWRQARVVVIYVAATALLLAVWAWQLSRFLVPLLPFILWMVIAGAGLLSTRRRWLRLLPALVAGVVMATAVAHVVPLIQSAVRCDRDAAPVSAACYAHAQRGFFAALRFVRESTPDSAIFLTVKEGTVGYLTGRRVVRHEEVRAASAVALSEQLRARRVDYVILTPLQYWGVQHLPPLREMCSQIEIVRKFSPVTYILKVHPGAAPPGENACAALAQYESASAGLPVTLTER